ncbi:MAG: AAA family ATPase [Dysosmobacter sp.]
MRIDGLSLDFFRNYVHLDAAFDPNINVIYGDNAQGKTNLLEAVAYLSGVSHRARYDRELIQFGVDHAFLKGHVFARDREFLLEAELHRGARRVLRSNGVKLKNGGELSGIFQSVLFCPEDLYLIREGAAARRGFLDDCICQLRPRYAQALAEYKRLHEHKIRILTRQRGKALPAGRAGRVFHEHGQGGSAADPLPGALYQAAVSGGPGHSRRFFRRPGTAYLTL